MHKRIVAIDDDPDILEALKIILESEGYDIETVVDSTYARDAVLRKKPSLVLLDIWMPNLDGTEVAKLLKDDIRTRSIPVILLSAIRNISRTADHVGATGYLSKPFNIEQLTTTVKKHIRSTH